MVDCPPNFDLALEIFVKDSTQMYKTENYISTRNRSKSQLINFVVDKHKTVDESFVSKKVLDHIEYYSFKDQFNLEIPKVLSYLKESFEKSEYILDLEDDWDENGSEKYDFTTWQNAISFVYDYAMTLHKDFKMKIQKPKIYHGPSKSIDVLFENDKYTLLINVKSSSPIANYFGKDDHGNTVKGTINTSKKNYSLIPIAFNF